MRSANKLFQPPKPSTFATAKTAHGLPAFARPIKEQLLQALLTNTVQDSFYSEAKGLLEETKRVHAEAIMNDGTFYARALVYARNRGLMRTQSIYGLANLAAHSQLDVAGTGQQSLFEQIFPSVILTPNDLADFHSMLRALKGGTDGGRRVKRVAGAWLTSKLGEYWAIKYGAQKKDGAFSLRDLFRIYHPATPDRQSKALVAWLLGKENVSTKEMLQIHCFEMLKAAKDPEDKVFLINTGRLPHEVTTTFAGKDKRVWQAIAAQMPAFALIRNLATIERAGVMDAVRPLIVEKLTSPGMAKARVFPFAILKAMDFVKDAEVKDALRTALETCLGSAEVLPGKTFIALDVSPSMWHAGLAEKSAIFAIAAARRAPGSKMITFHRQADAFPVSRVDSVMTQAKAIRQGSGTNQSIIIDYLEKNHAGEKFDNVVVVTDEQQESGEPFADVVSRWRGTRAGKGSKFFVANLAPYTAHGSLLKPAEGNYSVFGLTEASIQFIAKAAAGWGTFVEDVARGSTVSTADELEETIE